MTFTCEACNRILDTRHQHDKHWKLNHLGQQHRCFHCHTNFHTKEERIAHAITVHPNAQAKLYPPGVYPPGDLWAGDLWRVTYSDESAQAILYHFPGPQALLHHPHPPFYWHVIFWRSSGAAADRHTIYDRAKQLDRSSGSRHPRTKTVHQRVSQHHMTVPSTSTLATPRKRQQQSRIAGHPDHTTDVRKNRENVDLHIT